MKRDSMVKRLVMAVVAMAVLGTAYWLAAVNAQPIGSPREQIRGVLMDAVDAFNTGNSSGAMRIVSSDYKDSTGSDKDRLWLLVRRASASGKHEQVVLQSLDPQVTGDEATVPVTVVLHEPDGSGARSYHLTLHMRREPAHVWLVVPTHQWRITGADDFPDDWTGDLQ